MVHRSFIRQLLIAALVFLTGAGMVQARTYVVCVGINDYVKQKKLNLCVADADSIRYIFDHQRDAQTTILRNKQATKSNITSTISNLFARATADDIVIFYFSGHGYQGGFCAYDGNMPYSSLRSAISKSKARHKMIFADACFAGKMRKSKQSEQQQSQIKQAEVMLFLASRSNETSLESRNMKNGHFTDALKRGLRGAADSDRNRTITAKELFNYVSQKVKTSTHDRQHPVMWGKFPDTMPVIRW